MAQTPNQPPTSSMSKRVCLGKIVGTHGVKGLVKVLPFGDDPELLKSIAPLYIDEMSEKTLALTFKNFVGKHILASILGVENKEDAEALGKVELWVKRDQLPILDDEDEFYIEDLTGLKVFDIDKNMLGHIVSVPDYGAGQMLEIKPLGGRRFLIPFTKPHVPQVNIAHGFLVIQDWEIYQLEA